MYREQDINNMLDRMIKSIEELFEAVEAENLDTLNKYKEAAEHERNKKS